MIIREKRCRIAHPHTVHRVFADVATPVVFGSCRSAAPVEEVSVGWSVSADQIQHPACGLGWPAQAL